MCGISNNNTVKDYRCDAFKGKKYSGGNKVEVPTVKVL